MASIQNLSIILEYPDLQTDKAKDKQFYLPGDFLHGVVVLELGSSLIINALNLDVLGQAYTAWEMPGKKKTCEDCEKYVELSEAMLRPELSGQALPKGLHRFAFRIKLPENLPSTYHGTYGSVTYITRAVLEAEDETQSTFTSVPFMVLRRDPLPSQAYDKVTLTKGKTFIGLDMGKVKVEVTLDHGIAVPGQSILVNAEVNNWSDKDITLLEGALLVESTYKAKGKRLLFRRYLNKRQDFFDVNLRWGRRWTDVKILVPPFLADSGLQYCTIIDTKYIFQYRVQIKGQDDIVLETPLYVGYYQDIPDSPHDTTNMLMERMMPMENGSRRNSDASRYNNGSRRNSDATRYNASRRNSEVPSLSSWNPYRN